MSRADECGLLCIGFVKSCFFGFELADAFPLEIEAMCAMHEPIQHGVGDGGIADVLMPMLDRHLAGDYIVRLILDGTVVKVRLDRKATNISLLMVLGVRLDGQKLFLAKWRPKCRGVAESLEEAGHRLFTLTRLPQSQWK